TFRVLGTVVFTEEKTQHTVASCSYQNTPTDPNVFDEALGEIPSKEKQALLELLENHAHLFAFKTEYLGKTGLVKHTIDTQGKGP
ncbi:Uncharacterized protein APZ42_010022, partial [Daphnia magna]